MRKTNFEVFYPYNSTKDPFLVEIYGSNMNRLVVAYNGEEGIELFWDEKLSYYKGEVNGIPGFIL